MTHRLLIIDDEPDIRRLVQIALSRVAGWTVLTAASGAAGVTLAAAERPEAILLDVMMPGMDGPATLLLLQDHPQTRAIPVIFLTAKIQHADRARFAALGAKAILAKPFNPLLLADQIKESLGWSS